MSRIRICPEQAYLRAAEPFRHLIQLLLHSPHDPVVEQRRGMGVCNPSEVLPSHVYVLESCCRELEHALCEWSLLLACP